MTFSTAKGFRRLLTVTAIAAGVSALCVPTAALADPVASSFAVNWENDKVCDDQFEEILEMRGHACHGANIFNGDQLTDYANTQAFLPPHVFNFWNNFALPEVGVVDNTPGATDGLHVTSSTPLNSVMGTILVPGYSILDPNLNPDSINVPIHDAYIPSDMFSTARSRLPVGVVGDHKGDPIRNYVMEQPITLEDWNQARGRVYLGCRDDGTGFVRIKAKGLIPHLAYTGWQLFANTASVPGDQMEAVPAALGGAPNYMVANAKGKLVFERDLNYCPLDTTDVPLMYIALLAHWDHSLYGVTPDGFGQGWPAGPVAGDQLCFATGNDLINAYDPGTGDDDCDDDDDDVDDDSDME